MRFLKNLSLATKQAIGFGVIILFLITFNLFSLMKMLDQKNAAKNISQEAMPGVLLMSDFKNLISEFRLYEIAHISTLEISKKKEYEDQLFSISRNIDVLRTEYDTIPKSQKEIKLFNKIILEWGNYNELSNNLITTSRNLKNEQALEFHQEKSKRNFYNLKYHIEELNNLQKQKAKLSFEISNNIYEKGINFTIILFFIFLTLSIGVAIFLVRNITVPIRQLVQAAESVAKGNLQVILSIENRDEIGKLANAFNDMTASIRETKKENEVRDWLKSGQNELNEKMRGDWDMQALSENIITYLSGYLDAQVGTLYLWEEEEEVLKLSAGYAFSHREYLNNKIKLGEGMVGQAAYEKKMLSLSHIPDGYIRIRSALGETSPRNVIVAPCIYENKVVAVLEFGTIRNFLSKEISFLEMITENIAIAFHSTKASEKIKYLLDASRSQAEELQKQQTELKGSNNELQAQTRALKETEGELLAQQEELRASNEELEEKTQFLEQQKNEIAEKNAALQKAQNELELKAQELENASKYKSEFLANMSHELRTPLNSLLILTQNLMENKDQNLETKQIESLRIIHKSGKDLLSLINDILDLSKIEAGKMYVNIEKINLKDVSKNIISIFEHMVLSKPIDLKVEIDPKLPSFINSDFLRFDQILKNLISNAIKFTKEGSVIIRFYRPDNSVIFKQKNLNAENTIAISVKDTGIGIPDKKQKLIFDAFQQVEGGTSRKYGGTGLGLSISTNIVKLLGGELKLKSLVGKGSEFLFYIPMNLVEDKVFTNKNKNEQETTKKEEISKEIEAKTYDITGKNKILIIENNQNFAEILAEQCKEKGFEPLIAHSGEEGLRLLEEQKTHAIIIDLKLPKMNGCKVLDIIKNKIELQHIPVHIISSIEDDNDTLLKGAIGFLSKPIKRDDIEKVFSRIEKTIQKKIKNLLIVESNEEARKKLRLLIENNKLNILEASTASKAQKLMQENLFDCIILDLELSDMLGIEFLNRIYNNQNKNLPPIIVYTGKKITSEQEQQLEEYAQSIIINDIKTEDRLLDQVALFLYRVIKKMPVEINDIIAKFRKRDDILIGKKILITDDDMRNVFALSKIFTEKKMEIFKAENGEKALQILEKNPDIDLVLMDIMMPIMDGYQAIKEIRKKKQFIKLPVIALTAKAMIEDREKCLKAGANDYMPKPIDAERLFALLKVWLYK